MSTTTKNYGFTKPELIDVADITATNENWDKIDEELKNINTYVDEEVDNISAGVEEALDNLTPEEIGALAVYLNLESIGLTTGSETIESIANAIPENSMLLVDVSTSHAQIYPSEEGLLVVIKRRDDRIKFEFTPIVKTGQKPNLHYGVYMKVYSLWTGWVDIGNPTKHYKDLSDLGLTNETATTNGIIQAMASNSIAILEVNTNWTAATEIPDKYSTMVLFKKFNGRTSGILTSVASQGIWFGSQHSGGSFAGWKAQYGEHNITKGTTDLTAGSTELTNDSIYFVYE